MMYVFYALYLTFISKIKIIVLRIVLKRKRGILKLYIFFLSFSLKYSGCKRIGVC